MKSLTEVIIYTIIVLAGIFLINTHTFNTLLNTYLVYMILLLILPVYLIKHSGLSLSVSFGLQNNKMLYLYIFLLLVVAAASMSAYSPSKYAVAFFSFILAPLAEETAFRGYMVTMLKHKGIVKAVLYSGIAFGLAHLGVDNSFSSITLRVTIGILFAYIFFVSGKLLITVSLHLLFNVYTLLHAIPSLQSYISIAAALLLAFTALYEYYRIRR